MKEFIAIALFLLSLNLYAQDTEFDKANAYYNNGNYQEAIQGYQSILENNVHSAELYYNLANAYYKTNQVAPSIYYYEKALQLAPNDQDIKNNLSFAQNMTIDAIEEVPKLGFARFTAVVIKWFSYDGWAKLAVLSMVLFVITFLAYYFTLGTNKKRLFFISGAALLCIGIFTLTMAFQAYAVAQKDKPAIVFDQETEVKTDPNLRSETAFKLHEGTKVMIVESFNEDWSKVQIADGRTGWIPSESIKALKNINIFNK